MNKVIIIKTGYSEVLDLQNKSREVSFGDVIRVTPILHAFKNSHVTWLSDSKAFPLLEDNPLIHRLMHYDFTTRDQLLAERFDTLINLEKFHPLCGLANAINAWNKCGFRLDSETGTAEAYDRAFEALTVSADFSSKRANEKKVQEILFEIAGQKWNGEEYVLGYRPKTHEEYDVAFNVFVGQKWPSKAWPLEHWNSLEEILKGRGLKITRQDKQDEKMFKNLRAYMDWLNSARVIISNDSLGMHLGIALKKKVYGLFGPTSEKEVYFYGRGKGISPKILKECYPCLKPVCDGGYAHSCIELITPEQVAAEIK